MIGMLVRHIFRPLLVTLLLEVLASVLWGIREKRDIVQVVMVNCITNPFLNLSLLLAGTLFPYSVIRFLLPVMEVLIVLTEGCMFRAVLKNLKHPFRFSLVLNAVSFFVGRVLLRIF